MNDGKKGDLPLMPRLGEATQAGIAGVIATASETRNPIDIFPDWLAHGYEKTMSEILKALLDDKENKVSFDSQKDLIENQAVKKLISDEIAGYTKDYARIEQIKKFTLLENEWTQETDELTPTLKLKRRVINQKYSKQIECMYPQDNS